MFHLTSSINRKEKEKENVEINQNQIDKKSAREEQSLKSENKAADGSVVKNGVVSFEDEEDNVSESLGKRKKYHSSSEEEEEEDKEKSDRSSQKPQAKKKLKSSKSSTDKELLKQRFLEKQKLKESTQSSSAASSSKKSSVTGNKRVYEGSSDEEEPEEAVSKSSEQVLKTMQSFSNVWGDSADEETDSSDSSDSNEEEGNDEDVTKPSVRDKLKPDDSAARTDNIVQRYDPEAEDQDQFMRKDEVDDSQASAATTSKTFQIKTDLKQAFNNQTSSSRSENSSGGRGFSFGFDKSVEEVNFKAENYLVDEEDSISKVSSLKRDSKANFGMQLKRKGSGKVSTKPFFFTGDDDQRLEEGVAYFYDHKIDIDQLRTNYNSKRPELAHILREKFRRSGKRNPNPGMKDGFMKGGDKKASWSRGQGGGGVKKSFKKSYKKRD